MKISVEITLRSGAIALTAIAIFKILQALHTLFVFYKFLEPVGRTKEVAYDFVLLIPGAMWAAAATVVWGIYLSYKKQHEDEER